MKISDETLILESSDSQETVESATFTLSVTLDDHSSASGSVEFNAELTCPEG